MKKKEISPYSLFDLTSKFESGEFNLITDTLLKAITTRLSKIIPDDVEFGVDFTDNKILFDLGKDIQKIDTGLVIKEVEEILRKEGQPGVKVMFKQKKR